MKRLIGLVSLSVLAAGLLLGTAGTVAGRPLGQTGYGEADTEVLGIQVNRAETEGVLIDASEGDFDQVLQPGQPFRFVARGFAPDSEVDILLGSEPVLLGRVRADFAGVVDVDLVIPEDTPRGEHRLIARGRDPAGDPHEVAVRVFVGAKPEGGTGLSWIAWVIGLGAAAALASGTVLTRRRRQVV